MSDNAKRFWEAIQQGDFEAAKLFLGNDKSLAGRDFDPESRATDGFPLYHAAQQDNLELVRILLDSGADPDAKKVDLDDPQELGMPLVFAVDAEDWEMVNLLLDHGASVFAHPNCDVPFVSRLYYKAIEAGAPPNMALKTFASVDEDLMKRIPAVADDAPEVIKVWDRVLSLGGAPNHYAIVNAKDYETIEWLLRNRPADQSTDHWGGNIHEAFLYGASWFGNGRTVELCLAICADRHTTYAAAHSIRNAITSHNRPGSFEDYRRVIELNLNYLKENDALYEHDFFLPLHQLASSFVADYFYGPLGERPTVEHQMTLAKMFIDAGFDVNLILKDSDDSALALAIAFGHAEFADLLRANGAAEPESERLSKLIDETFWNWVQRSHEAAIERAVKRDPSLAGKNFKPESKHTDGFPLYHATKKLNAEMTKSLLNAGADPDAKLDTDAPREIGMPLLNAFHEANARGVGNYYLVHLILDFKPELNAHPYCSTPFVDCCFNNLFDTNQAYEPGDVWRYKNDSAAEVADLFRRSYAIYLGSDVDTKSSSSTQDSEDIPELVLLRRVVGMGGQPSLFTLVRHQQHDLINELLRKCPSENGTAMDWPNGTVFKNIRGAATWCGYPETAKACIELCPNLYTPDVARHSIENSIRSHNRDGGIEQYHQLIEFQLQFLKQSEALLNDRYDSGDPFSPLHWLADDFIEPKNYGFKCQPLSTEDDLIRLAKLFLNYGLDVNALDSKAKTTPLQIARSKELKQFESFLIEHGANEGNNNANSTERNTKLNRWQLDGWQHAIENENVEGVKTILENDWTHALQCLQKFRKDGTWYLMDPLCEVAQRDNIELAKLILETERSPNYTYGQGQWNGEVHGAQCLAWAVSNEMCELLIKSGADPKTIEEIEVPHLDESPIPFEQTTNDLGLRWQLAIEAGDERTVRKLLAAHPHLAHQVTMDRRRDGRMGHRSRNPLWISAQAGNLSIVKMMIETGYDKSKLVDAVELASPEVAAYLIDDLGVEAKPNVGLMAYIGDTESLKFWFDRGYKVEDRMLLDACGSRGRLRGHKQDSRGAWPEKFRETVRVLIDAGANVNGRMPSGDKKYEGCKPWRMNGETPLHFSAGNWDPVQIQMLLDAGADKTLTNDLGETPYDWAVKFDAPDETKKLLAVGP